MGWAVISRFDLEEEKKLQQPRSPRDDCRYFPHYYPTNEEAKKSVERESDDGMAFRSKEIMKKVLRKVGEKELSPSVKEQLKKCMPDSKVVMNRADRGIFAGRHIRYGNRVSEDGGNKSRRCWKPNVQEKRLFSYILDRQIRVKVSTHAIRCIDKAGGFDEYFLKTPYRKMDTELGVAWKAKIEKLYEELGPLTVAHITPKTESKPQEETDGQKLDQDDATDADAHEQLVANS
ncbi:hypothetical protein QQ045_012405 [Rhodiola kirilowii]